MEITNLIEMVMYLRFSDWPISIHNWVYIFHRVLSDPYSAVLHRLCVHGSDRRQGGLSSR